MRRFLLTVMAFMLGLTAFAVEGEDMTALFSGAGCDSDEAFTYWSITDASATFHLNTWSTEGNAGNDPSGLVIPFIEDWLSKGNNLSTCTMSHAAVSGLKGGTYVVSALIRCYNESGEQTVDGGSMFANDQEVLLGDEKFGTYFTYNSMLGIYGTYVLFVTIPEGGSLEFGIKLNQPNFNWVAFKNFTVVRYDDANGYWRDKCRALFDGCEGAAMSAASKSSYDALMAAVDAITSEEGAAAFIEAHAAEAAAIAADAAIYTKMGELIAKAKADYNEYNIDADKLQAGLADAEAAYNAAQLDTEGMTEAHATFFAIYNDYIAANLNGEDGVDYTEWITNPTVRTSKDGWTITSAAYSQSVANNEMEFWNGDAYTVEMSQTIEGLPNGRYKVAVTGFYRAGWNDAGAAYAEGSEDVTAVLFAGRNSAPLHSLYEHTTDEFASTGNLSGYIDNMVNAELAFNAGLYGPQDAYGEEDGHNVVEAIVTNGTLTIGLRNEAAPAGAWHIFRDFTLTYYGNFPGVLLAGLIEEVQTFLDENADVLLEGVSYELSDASILALEYTSDGYDKAEVQAAYDALDEAYANAKKSIEVVEQIRTLMAEMEELANLDYPGVDDLMSAYAELSFIVDEGGDDDTTCEVVFNYLDMANEAIQAYYLSQEATHDNPADYTFLLTNPTLRENATGWSGSTPGLEYNVMEFYNMDFDMYQELAVANGKYRVSVTGFYREASNDGGAAHAAGTENLSAKLYANLSTTSMMSLYTHTATDMGITSSEVLSDYVNMRVSTAEAFDNGFYQGAEGVDDGNTVDVIVYDGKLTIGIRNVSHQDYCWCTFRDFKLQYFGPATQEDMLEAWAAAQADADAVAAVLLPGDAVAFNASYADAKALAASGQYLEACALINPVVQDYQSIYATTLAFRKGNYQTLADLKTDASADVTAIIDKVLSFADAALTADDATTAILSDLDSRLGGYVSYMQAYINAEAAVAGGTYPQTYADRVTTVMAAHRAQLTALLCSTDYTTAYLAELEDAVYIMQLSAVVFTLKPGDVTSALLQNPALDDTSAAGWTVEKGTGNGPTISGQHYTGNTANYYLDSWNGTAGKLNFSAYQIIRGLPNGTYELSCAARTDGDNAFIFAAASENIADESTLFEPIRNYAAERGELWEADSIKWSVDGSESDIYNANGGIGWGWSQHTISDIKVTDHLLIVGMTTNSEYSGQSFTGTWYSADDWKLVLVEKGPETSWEIVSHVDGQAAEATVVAQEYYTPSGTRLAAPQQGLLIVRRQLSDGSTQVQKVLVR